MHANRCLPALALLLCLPARADEGAAKEPPRTDARPVEEKMSCCAGEEGREKAICLKGKAKASAAGKKNAAKPKAAVATAPEHQVAAPPVPAPGAANMIVTRDPETGELRNATAAERETLFGRHPLAAPEHKVVALPDGSVMVELGEADMSYAVATRNPDGTVTQTCVHGDPAPAPSKPVDR